MNRYIVQRSLQSILTLAILSIVVFVLTWVSGDPLLYMMPQEELVNHDLEVLRHELGLDKPVYYQYYNFVSRAVRLDFGRSTIYRRSAWGVIQDRIVPSVHLGVMSLLLVLAIAFPVGVYAAYNRGRIGDAVARTIAFAGQSIPEFWLAIILILIFVVYLNWLPAAGRTGGWTHWILPSLTAGWFSMAGLLRITRSSVLEVLGSDYIRTARAKGLRESNVLWRHIVRNSLITVITSVALLAVGMLNGIVLVETVFGWPGLGQLLAASVMSRDLFVVQGIAMLIGSAFLLTNFLADILYGVVDPRIRITS